MAVAHNAMPDHRTSGDIERGKQRSGAMALVVVIQHAVWLYLRFTLSYRDVEDLLAERGLDISYETIRSWVLKFGSA